MIEYATDASWPPLPPAITTAHREWDAWQRGSDALSAFYGTQGGNTASGYVRPSQYAGGIVGAVSRLFWGRPLPVGQTRKRLHHPLAATIAERSADVLFSQELGIDVTGDDAHLSAILDGNGWQSLLPEVAQVAAGTGGVYLRASWDTGVADHVLIDYARADQAVPSFAFRKLQTVTFWRIVAEDGHRVWRHLEGHERGRTVHRLYEGTADKLGRLVSLQDRPETAWLAPLVTEDYIETGIDRLAVTYVPNKRPVDRWSNVPQARALGGADIEDALDLLDALDEDLNGERRDVRLGKGRLMVASALLDNLGAGQGAAMDLDREVYEQVTFAQGQNASIDQMIHGEQFDMRTVEWLDKIKARCAEIVFSAGYSPQTFGLPDTAATTATEVESREKRTAETRDRKARYWTVGLEEFLRTCTALQSAQFSKGQEVEVKVSFPPYTLPTMKDAAQVVAVAGDAMSTRTKVEILHPDWDTDQVDAEVAEIKAGTPDPSVTVVDPFGRMGTTDQPAVEDSPTATPAA